MICFFVMYGSKNVRAISVAYWLDRGFSKKCMSETALLRLLSFGRPLASIAIMSCI